MPLVQLDRGILVGVVGVMFTMGLLLCVLFPSQYSLSFGPKSTAKRPIRVQPFAERQRPDKDPPAAKVLRPRRTRRTVQTDGADRADADRLMSVRIKLLTKLASPDVIAVLKLSKEQLREINRTVQTLFDGSVPKEETVEQAYARVLELLTPEQRKQLFALENE